MPSGKILAATVLLALAGLGAVGYAMRGPQHEVIESSAVTLDTSQSPSAPVEITPVEQETAELEASPTPSAPELRLERASSDAPLPSQIRNVAPSGIAAPAVSGPLKRIAAPERPQDAVDAEPIPDGTLVLRRPHVVDAGTLKTDNYTVRLAHIDALPGDETCVSRLGGKWPCGARARTSLRGLVRMFAVECEKVEDLGVREFTAVCSRKNITLNAWLVEYGWARPREGAPQEFAALAAKAKQEKRGMWQSEWLAELPPAADLVAPELGLEEAQAPLDDAFSIEAADLPALPPS